MRHSLRVLHVSPYFEDAWAFGGIPRVVSRLTRGLARRGHRVQVFTTDAKGPEERLQPGPGSDRNRPWSYPPGEDPDAVSLTVFPNLFGGLAHRYQFYTPRGLSQSLAQKAPDLDLGHLHACHNLPVAQAARGLRRAGIPYILQPNGTGPRIESRRWAKFLFDNTFARDLLEGASGLLAVSLAERRQLRSLGVPDEKIHLLPNPLDLGELDPKPKPGEIQRRWPGEGRTVVYLGQLTPRKGLTTLIRALAATPDDLRLAIFGADRGMVKTLRILALKLGIESRVAFLGCIEGKLRFSVLAEADLVAYASRHEVFGLSAFEALLVGTPVIVGDDSGCGELVDRFGGGLTIPPGRVDSLTTAINQILDDPDRFRHEAHEAGSRLRLELDTETVCESLESIYETVLDRHGRNCDG
jgi:glycosyltransferase involved in cell wall biosynthesis